MSALAGRPHLSRNTYLWREGRIRLPFDFDHNLEFGITLTHEQHYMSRLVLLMTTSLSDARHSSTISAMFTIVIVNAWSKKEMSM